MVILQSLGIHFGENQFDNVMQVLDVISKFSYHQAYHLSQELNGNKIGIL